MSASHIRIGCLDSRSTVADTCLVSRASQLLPHRPSDVLPFGARHSGLITSPRPTGQRLMRNRAPPGGCVRRGLADLVTESGREFPVCRPGLGPLAVWPIAVQSRYSARVPARSQGRACSESSRSVVRNCSLCASFRVLVTTPKDIEVLGLALRLMARTHECKMTRFALLIRARATKRPARYRRSGLPTQHGGPVKIRINQ